MKKLLLRGIAIGIVYGVAAVMLVRFIQDRSRLDGDRGRTDSFVYHYQIDLEYLLLPLRRWLEEYIYSLHLDYGICKWSLMIAWSLIMGVAISAFWHGVSRVALRPRLLCIAGMLLALSSACYIFLHRDHFAANLRMRSPERVRAECRALLARKRLEKPGESSWLVHENIPAFLRRMGADRVSVEEEVVRICFRYDGDLTSSEWGVIYDPGQRWQRHDMPDRYPTEPLWYRDFYEYRIIGE